MKKEKKRILLATDSYYYLPTANGICVEAIANELTNQNIETHVLCFRRDNEPKDEIVNNIHVHRIKMDWVNQLRYKYESRKQDFLQILYKKIMILLNRLEAMLFIKWFPMRSPLFCIRYLREMKKLQYKYKYDVIVASYCPFEAAYALGKIKQYDNVKTAIYCLDSFTNLKKRFFLSVEFQDKRAWKWEKSFFKVSDLILVLKCHEKHYRKDRYSEFDERISIVDIPHIIERKKNVDQLKKEKNDPIKMVYAGKIRDDLLQPVIQLLTPFLREGILILDIYGRNTSELLDTLCEPDVRSKINLKGFISHEKMIEVEETSDILLSMGNSNTDFIPSKIFEYISLRKKILHIYNYDNDSSLPYYKLYPSSCCLDVKNDLEDNIRKMRHFLNEPLNELDFNDIKCLYEKNTPQYTANVIIDLVDKA